MDKETSGSLHWIMDSRTSRALGVISNSPYTTNSRHFMRLDHMHIRECCVVTRELKALGMGKEAGGWWLLAE
jgi:hypothetical protein